MIVSLYGEVCDLKFYFVIFDFEIFLSNVFQCFCDYVYFYMEFDEISKFDKVSYEISSFGVY